MEIVSKTKRDKILKNLGQGVAIAIGTAGAVVVSKLAKGKLPNPWLEPLVTLVPGVAATLMGSDDKELVKALGMGFIVVGTLDVANKATSNSTNSIVQKINEYVPKLNGIGEYNPMQQSVMGPDYIPAEQAVMGMGDVPEHLRLVA